MDNETKIKGLIDNFYEIISGKADEERNWSCFKTLFFTNAHLIPMRFDINEKCITIPFDIESYIVRLESFLKTTDFYEYAINYEIKVFGNIAHVCSEYEAKTSPDDDKPIKKGINLVQLINDGIVWKIASMLWQDN